MKNEKLISTVLIGSALVSSSCVEQNTQSQLPEITQTSPIASLTPEITATDYVVVFPTPTETVTPTEAVVESKIDPIFTASMEGSYKGVNVKLNIVTDKSLSPYITKLDFNPNFVNSQGENSKEALAKFVTWIFYRIKEANNGKVVTDEGYVQFLADWADAQASNGDMTKWDKVKVSIKVDDPAIAGYNAESKDFYPMYNGPSVEGVNSISEMDIVFVNTKDMTDEVKIHPRSISSGQGSAINFASEKMSIIMGTYSGILVPPKADEGIINFMKLIPSVIESRTPYYDKTSEKILQNVVKMGAITFFPK